MKVYKIITIVLRLFLGGMMVYGGINKFEKPIPTPIEVVEKAKQFTTPEKENMLQIVLYINGLKQTNFFWQMLGVCEILFGMLLIIQGTSFIGAVLLLPITANIFLFHLFLETHELGELFLTLGLFLINILLIMNDFKYWKPLIWNKNVFKF